jgi:mono/diheme cytochrome c family protein
MNRHTGLIVTLLGGALVAASAGASAQDPGRGELLYQTSCIACHDSVVHIRSDRRALSPEQLRAQVVRWAGIARPEWSDEDIADVVRYLDTTYYKFPPKTESR